MKIKKKKKGNKNKISKSSRKESLKMADKRWRTRPKRPSKYPYLITISSFRRNIYITAADFKGEIRVWTHIGRYKLGFRGKLRKYKSAVIEIITIFIKKLKKYGISNIFLKKKSLWYKQYWFNKALDKSNKIEKKKFSLRILGMWAELNVSFNGCRHRKKRRKGSRKRKKKKWRTGVFSVPWFQDWEKETLNYDK